MAIKAHLIPKRGLTVRDPLTAQALPEAGAEMTLTPYWLRRLADGDVREAQTAKPAKASPNPRSQE